MSLTSSSWFAPGDFFFSRSTFSAQVSEVVNLPLKDKKQCIWCIIETGLYRKPVVILLLINGYLGLVLNLF